MSIAGRMDENKKARAVVPPGNRMLAHCFTWRQLAANHHETSIMIET
jgi:hypothetical protein